MCRYPAAFGFFGDQLHDWIIPEIPQGKANPRLNFVNPNHNTSGFDVTHYGTDGTELETKTNYSVSAGTGS